MNDHLPPIDRDEIMASMTSLLTWEELFPNFDRDLEEFYRDREKFYADLEGSDP